MKQPYDFLRLKQLGILFGNPSVRISDGHAVPLHAAAVRRGNVQIDQLLSLFQKTDHVAVQRGKRSDIRIRRRCDQQVLREPAALVRTDIFVPRTIILAAFIAQRRVLFVVKPALFQDKNSGNGGFSCDRKHSLEMIAHHENRQTLYHLEKTGGKFCLPTVVIRIIMCYNVNI